MSNSTRLATVRQRQQMRRVGRVERQAQAVARLELGDDREQANGGDYGRRTVDFAPMTGSTASSTCERYGSRPQRYGSRPQRHRIDARPRAKLRGVTLWASGGRTHPSTPADRPRTAAAIRVAHNVRKQASKSGGFTCSARPKGVICRNDSTGHGFFISRARSFRF
jgi:hypothetical protein